MIETDQMPLGSHVDCEYNEVSMTCVLFVTSLLLTPCTHPLQKLAEGSRYLEVHYTARESSKTFQRLSCVISAPRLSL